MDHITFSKVTAGDKLYIVSNVFYTVNAHICKSLNFSCLYFTFPLFSMATGNLQEAMGLHFAMFVPTLHNLCDPQQARKWLPLANSFQVVGTYAQTEMGHG